MWLQRWDVKCNIQQISSSSSCSLTSTLILQVLNFLFLLEKNIHCNYILESLMMLQVMIFSGEREKQSIIFFYEIFLSPHKPSDLQNVSMIGWGVTVTHGAMLVNNSPHKHNKQKIYQNTECLKSQYLVFFQMIPNKTEWVANAQSFPIFLYAWEVILYPLKWTKCQNSKRSPLELSASIEHINTHNTIADPKKKLWCCTTKNQISTGLKPNSKLPLHKTTVIIQRFWKKL